MPDAILYLDTSDLYGEPSEKVLRESREKAQLLGRGPVVVQSLHAGFTRVASEPAASSAPAEVRSSGDT